MDVISFYLVALKKGTDLDTTNITEIVLIPKIPNPTYPTNFRPISLCSVLYKLVAKVLANMLQNIIGRCFDEAQSAFILRRLISDNISVAYEMLDSFRKKHVGRRGLMAIKLDMYKAYDRVE